MILFRKNETLVVLLMEKLSSRRHRRSSLRFLVFSHLIIILVTGKSFRLRIVEIIFVDFHLAVRLIIRERQLAEMIRRLKSKERREALANVVRAFDASYPFSTRIFEGSLNVVSSIGVTRRATTTSAPPIVLSGSVLMDERKANRSQKVRSGTNLQFSDAVLITVDLLQA